MVEANLEGYKNALKYAIHKMDKLIPDSEELRTVIEGPNNELFELGFTISKPEGEQVSVSIKLYQYIDG